MIYSAKKIPLDSVFFSSINNDKEKEAEEKAKAKIKERETENGDRRQETGKA